MFGTNLTHIFLNDSIILELPSSWFVISWNSFSLTSSNRYFRMWIWQWATRRYSNRLWWRKLGISRVRGRRSRVFKWLLSNRIVLRRFIRRLGGHREEMRWGKGKLRRGSSILIGVWILSSFSNWIRRIGWKSWKKSCIPMWIRGSRRNTKLGRCNLVSQG